MRRARTHGAGSPHGDVGLVVPRERLAEVDVERQNTVLQRGGDIIGLFGVSDDQITTLSVGRMAEVFAGHPNRC